MIDRTHALPLTRQAEVLKLSRSGCFLHASGVGRLLVGIRA